MTEKLSSLSRTVGAADAKPTESMYAVFEDLSERFEVQRNRLNQVIEEEVGPLMARRWRDRQFKGPAGCWRDSSH